MKLFPIAALGAALLIHIPAASAQMFVSREHRACIHRIQAKGNLAITYAMTGCTNAAAMRQRDRMNRILKVLMKDPTRIGGAHRNPDADKSRKQFAAIQAQWQAFMQEQCRWVGSQYTRGYDSALASAICRAHHLRRRADYLASLVT